MTDAEKLRMAANTIKDIYPRHYFADGSLSSALISELYRIADLLDAFPPETLAAIKAGTMVAVPKEPTDKMVDASGWPW